MSDGARDNMMWATALVDGLTASGVAHAVVSPGARSTPLTLACLRHPALTTWVQVDERSAAYFALGLAKARNQPAVLVCTSGSAPAHWFPAVIEADMGGVPLILLSADRPPELRGCGANQATDQIRLFGGHVRGFHELPCADPAPRMLDWLRRWAARAVDQSRWPLAGPVHVNVPLREPLVHGAPLPDMPPRQAVRVVDPVMDLPQDEAERLTRELAGGRGMLVCGDGVFDPVFPAALAALARRWGCPVLADPLSGLRFGPHDREAVLVRYDAFLRRKDIPRPDWVLRFGAMPVSKSLQHYLDSLDDIPHLVVDAAGRWPDPLHRVTTLLRAEPHRVCRRLSAAGGAASPDWMARFATLEARAAGLAEADPPLEAAVLGRVTERLPPGATLFCGNSMAVRDLDSYSGSAAKALRVVCNRGSSGIDGHVSTALGLAAAGCKPLVALLGDLAFHHDMNGLAAARGLDAVFVVVNNGGGGIFEYLPQTELDTFERAWLTDVGLDFRHAAAMYGLVYRKVDDAGGFDAALTDALKGGIHLIEVVVDRTSSVAKHRAYWQSVAD